MRSARAAAALLALFAMPGLAAAPANGPEPPAVLAHGEYLFRAGGCYSCHTDVKGGGRPLAGGRALDTPFGRFYAPNITPDPETGIGRWSEADFLRAMREGVDPRGEHYYPAFPYTSYTRMTDADLRALWAWLRAQPPVRQANRPHELVWYARSRTLLSLWKWRYFTPGVYRPDPARPPSWNRGAYLAEAAGHCGECHTPRNWAGVPDAARRHAGVPAGDGSRAVPNITPDRRTGIGRWRVADLATYLQTGLRPDGDAAGGAMAEVIDNGLKYLRPDDLAAIAEYLLSLPAVEHPVRTDRRAGRRDGLEW